MFRVLLVVASLAGTAPQFLRAQAPAAPTNVVVRLDARTPIVSWTPGAGSADGFILQRSEDEGATWTVVARVSGTLSEASDIAPPVGPALRYRVLAEGSGDQSAATPADGTVFLPADPGQVAANALGPYAVDLTWRASPPARQYNVLRRALDDDEWEVVAEAVEDTRWVDRDLTPRTEYAYQVVALGADSGDGAERLSSPGTTSRVSVATESLADARERSECYLNSLTNPERHDCSHVMVSAIRSLAGEIPESEWFSIQLKFSGNRSRGFTLLYADLNLSRNSPDDGDASTGGADPTAADDSGVADVFNDATVAVSWWLSMDDARRGTYVGAMLKVFDGEPFAAIHIGGMEKIQSDFFGSYLTFSPLMLPIRPKGLPVRLSEDVPTPPSLGPIGPLSGRLFPLNVFGIGREYDASEMFKDRAKMYVEFSLRSDRGPAFFQTFAARGGLLVPYWRGEPSFRISLLVPVGGVHAFK